MKFTMVHNNFNVRDLDKSIKFYEDALGLKPGRRIEPADGSFKIVYLEDGSSNHQLELTWLRDWDRPYNLGDNEFHLAFVVDDYEGAFKSTKKWVVLCMKTLTWAFTSLPTRTVIGWK